MNDNKLIAEFMGLVVSDSDNYTSELHTNVDADLKYHTSWDWLMPVVQECLVGEAEQSEEVSNTTIKHIYEAICNQDIHYAHKSVVQFIKTQNNERQ